MSKKIKSKRNYKLLATVFALTFTFLSLVCLFVIPIDTVRVGECGGAKPIRLSLLNGDKKKLEVARKEANERAARKAEALRRNPDIAMGCSIGPTYKLYVI